jgi:hypothetical protein
VTRLEVRSISRDSDRWRKVGTALQQLNTLSRSAAAV